VNVRGAARSGRKKKMVRLLSALWAAEKKGKGHPIQTVQEKRKKHNLRPAGRRLSGARKKSNGGCGDRHIFTGGGGGWGGGRGDVRGRSSAGKKSILTFVIVFARRTEKKEGGSCLHPLPGGRKKKGKMM